MALLQVRGAGVRLTWSRGRWLVLRGGQEVRRVRPRDVDEIQLLGAVELGAGARAAALARGVPVVLFTADGRYRGRLDGPRSPTGALQLAQVRWLTAPDRVLSLAAAFVAGKVASERRLLLALQRSRRSEAVAAAASALRARLDRIPEATSVDSLRGHEGEAAATYFGAWNDLIVNDAFPWTGRSRRPPRDPVNACLSYLYTLLATRVEDALLGVGLLPGLGALHEPGPSRQPLVYDLVEEFRAPMVDRLVLRLVNRRQLAPEDFDDPAWRRPSFPAGMRARDATTTSPTSLRGSGAVYLGASARHLLVREFYAVLRSDLLDHDDGSSARADWLLQRQARRLARLFQGKEAGYRPFLSGAQ